MSRTEPSRPSVSSTTSTTVSSDYSQQSDKLSLESGHASHEENGRAVDAIFITPLDPVIRTADGNRLPAVPVHEAHKINVLKDKKDGRKGMSRGQTRPRGMSRFDRVNKKDANGNGLRASKETDGSDTKGEGEGERLESAVPPSRTHPLFPPLPLYGPSSTLRNLQCLSFRITSFFLSTGFLLVIVLGAVFTSIPKLFALIWSLVTFRDPKRKRPFYEEERKRAAARKAKEKRWVEEKKTRRKDRKNVVQNTEKYTTLEGGPDPLICDAPYYARRVGLDLEEFKVQTEDGFIITLWHVYDPKEYTPPSAKKRRESSPEVFTHNTDSNGNEKHNTTGSQYRDGQRRYPVLLMHGLLQSAGAYCVNDDDSLAFMLHKSGYDVWLGNNRCGFHPEHSLLKYSDPRMWAWNIRQMGVLDLPALISRVLEETGFPRLGLVCHSQGTTQTFVALAKEQRPDLGEKISVFCALAPAVYAGPLIGKMYFKFMRVISPSMFRIFFGIHSFIPLMMTMHSTLPGWLYGAMGYRVFSFLFNWTDTRWDRGLRDRFFMFSPVYVSSESMRWWLGRECFAKHKCVLSTKEEGRIEDEEDEDDDDNDNDDTPTEHIDGERLEEAEKKESNKKREERERTAWYNDQVPPMALWVAGSDDLVDGRRLLRRFERGREPNVNLVHSRVIPEYEHLDVLWAMDAIEKVGWEVREVIWKCMNSEERGLCRRIEGVEDEVSLEKRPVVREREVEV